MSHDAMVDLFLHSAGVAYLGSVLMVQRIGGLHLHTGVCASAKGRGCSPRREVRASKLNRILQPPVSALTGLSIDIESLTIYSFYK